MSNTELIFVVTCIACAGIGLVVGIGIKGIRNAIRQAPADDCSPSYDELSATAADWCNRLRRIAALPVDNQPTRNLKKAVQIARGD